ncbi:MAG: GNAT family N-acetyltransferase [Gammaproteobacteria bacterium]|nr:GNAT family N-acetyltransferase [Gammaproteobacteria bacterium]
MRELDNPAWHALKGEQKAFGVVGERAARYLPDISPIAAVADRSAEALVELAAFVEPGRFVALFAPGELPDDLWRLGAMAPLSQWVCPEPPVFDAEIDWIELTDADAGEMLRLARETDPGPFEARTNRLGDYVGVVRDGRLVAMAGERICFPGYREVSAVCTDAAYTGRGFAQALVVEIVRRQQRAGCVPFLHVRTGSPAEAQAIHVYEKLGFQKRGDYAMTVLVRK